jgi:nucleotide-binding universal stress UspA family protein
MAWQIARSVDADLFVIHVTDRMKGVAGRLSDEDRAAVEAGVAEDVRGELQQGLAGNVPPELADRVEIRFGNTAWALRQAVDDYDAGLLVLGGKRHAPPVRWFGGSTVHNVVRTVDTPLLVAASVPDRIGRVLVATDLSDAGPPTLEVALRFVTAFRSQVRILHVVEPLPSIPDVGVQLDEGEHLAAAEAGFQRLVAGSPDTERAETVVRHGTAARTITEEAEQWGADVVVVGSHGKGLVDRVLLGSTTERLLNRLPTSVLVIPMRVPGA